MSTPENFTKDLNRFGKKLDDVLVVVVKAVAIELRLRVAGKTPILTGRASASWNANAGAPNLLHKPPSYYNPDGAPTDGTVNLSGLRLGQPVFVSNSVPYIGELNAGSSMKAPAGFIEASVLEVELLLPQVVSQARSTIGV